MRNSKLLLLCLALMLCGDLMAQNAGVTTFTRLEWGETEYKITYTKNGVEKVLKGKHRIPPSDQFMPTGSGQLATKPDDVITEYNLNYDLLDSLTWAYCNKYRRTLDLPPVKYSKPIHQAASSHSYYMQYFNDLTHDETKEIPHRKAEQEHYQKVFSGAAEICLYNNVVLNQDTYREAAQMCIDQWMNSPGHNAIMISKSYKFNGFGAALQSSDHYYINEEKLAEHNPQLLATIKRECPGALTMRSASSYNWVRLWCSANFRWSEPEVFVASNNRPNNRTVPSNRDVEENDTPADNSHLAAVQIRRKPSDRTTNTNNNVRQSSTKKRRNTKRRGGNDFMAKTKDWWRRKTYNSKRKRLVRKNRRRRNKR